MIASNNPNRIDTQMDVSVVTSLTNNVWLDNKQRIIVARLPKDKKDILQRLKCPYKEETSDTIIGYMPDCLGAYRLLYHFGETDIIKAVPIYKDNTFLIEGQYQPMEHQRLTAAFMCIFPRCYVLSDCRLGKTGSAIMAMDYLQNVQAFPGAALIITTLTTVTSVWVPSLQKSCPWKTIHILHGKKDLKYLEEPTNYFVTNYDTIRTNQTEFINAVKQRQIGYVLVDELTHCGNISAQRTKAISKVINTTGLPYACGMTGTPGSDPEPVYGMCKTINPAIFPYRTKTGWLAATTYQYGQYSSQRVNLDHTPKLIFEAMQPAIRFKKEEILDLPPIVEQIRVCALLKEQETAIAKIWKDAVLEFASGPQITASNAAVRLNKILQLAQGFALDEDGNMVNLLPAKFNDPRSQTILDVISETDRKIVIFSMFRKRLSLLQNLLNLHHISNAVIHGDITGDQRGDILKKFNDDPDPRVLIAHPVTVGYGTELSVADTLIIDGPLLLGGFSYKQTLERLSSIKQVSSKISIIKIAGDSREVKLFNRMDQDQQVAQAIAGLFEEARRDLYGK